MKSIVLLMFGIILCAILVGLLQSQFTTSQLEKILISYKKTPVVGGSLDIPKRSITSTVGGVDINIGFPDIRTF
jgi:hypothetical protein